MCLTFMNHQSIIFKIMNKNSYLHRKRVALVLLPLGELQLIFRRLYTAHIQPSTFIRIRFANTFLQLQRL